MIKQGFDEMGKDLSTLKVEVKQDLSILKTDVSALKTDVSTIKTDIEDIKLRLDNVPYRFEFIELEKRVDRLEDAAEIGNK